MRLKISSLNTFHTKNRRVCVVCVCIACHLSIRILYAASLFSITPQYFDFFALVHFSPLSSMKHTTKMIIWPFNNIKTKEPNKNRLLINWHSKYTTTATTTKIKEIQKIKERIFFWKFSSGMMEWWIKRNYLYMKIYLVVQYVRQCVCVCVCLRKRLDVHVPEIFDQFFVVVVADVVEFLSLLCCECRFRFDKFQPNTFDEYSSLSECIFNFTIYYVYWIHTIY